MIIPLCTFLALLAVPTLEQESVSTPISPCPNVFTYEPTTSELGRWYGNVNLSTDITLHSLWLNIMLDSKADMLGNWIGHVSTTNNKDFKIENADMQINPGPTVRMRIFVQYNPLNKTPRLLMIRLNGREICNANTPQLNVNRGETVEVETRRPPAVNFGSIEMKPINPPKDLPRPVFPRPTNNNTNILNIPSVDNQNRPNNSYGLTTQTAALSKPSPPESTDDTSNTSSPEGQSQCGTVVLTAVPLVVNGAPTLEGQWPWQIALYQTRGVEHRYTCAGTLVSHKHVITAAHCVTRKASQRLVDQNTLTVYLGKHNLRISMEGVQIRFVKEIFVNPNYNASTFSHNVAILELHEPVTYSDWVRPACFWPSTEEDLKNIIGKKGSVVGWGFDDTGVATEELSLVEMLVVSQETCIRSYSEFFERFTTEYTYCAGYRDGTSVCNGDSGSGMVFRMNGIWFLRGLVSLSVGRPKENRCDPSDYTIFTDLAKFSPWIYSIVNARATFPRSNPLLD